MHIKTLVIGNATGKLLELQEDTEYTVTGWKYDYENHVCYIYVDIH